MFTGWEVVVVGYAGAKKLQAFIEELAIMLGLELMLVVFRLGTRRTRIRIRICSSIWPDLRAKSQESCKTAKARRGGEPGMSPANVFGFWPRS